ncbi:MAG: serine/threonine-protein kinase [Gemmataceae bacterium]
MRIPGLSGRHAVPPERSGVIRRDTADPAALFGATVLGRYKVDSYLGEGSNAHVFLGHPLSDPGRPVVVKRIKPHVLANPRFRQFFDNEVASMGQFAHPYVVRLRDASLDDPVGPVLVLDYIPGITLEALLARHRRLPPDRVGRLLGPLCHALQAAADWGIVHRDLKPANLMVVGADKPTESVRVMDFGFAGFTAKPHIQLAELTGTGQVFACGTPAYVSPEMVRGDPVDHRGDLYSVGVILYELLTGRLPFDVRSQERMLAAHLHDPPPPFAKIGVFNLPARLETVVQTALSKYPSERYQSARQLAEEFGKAIGADVWAEAAPVREPAPAAKPDSVIVECVLADPPPARPEDKYVLSDTFEAALPERLAAAKLRGFVEDTNGLVVASDPGLIRVHIDPPGGRAAAQGSKLFSFLAATRPVRGKEPIELDLQMHKLDATRVQVQVCFRPLGKHLPPDLAQWQERCEEVYSTLRKYVMAG